jgi:hypothetical protein
MAFRDVGEIDADLAALTGAIGPSSFFENLRSVDSRDRTVFLNDFGEVLFFPDRMTITLFIIKPLHKHGKAWPSRFDATYMIAARFSCARFDPDFSFLAGHIGRDVLAALA